MKREIKKKVLAVYIREPVLEVFDNFVKSENYIKGEIVEKSLIMFLKSKNVVISSSSPNASNSQNEPIGEAD